MGIGGGGVYRVDTGSGSAERRKEGGGTQWEPSNEFIALSGEGRMRKGEEGVKQGDRCLLVHNVLERDQIFYFASRFYTYIL